MADCTPIRTRKCVSFTPLDDLLWNRMQDRQNSWIAAQEAAKEKAAQAKAQKIADILSSYTFTLDEFNTLFNAQGACYQAAMSIVSKTDCNLRFLVVAKLQETGEEWSCTCPPFHQEEGPIFIQAVQARIEQKRSQRLQKAA